MPEEHSVVVSAQTNENLKQQRLWGKMPDVSIRSFTNTSDSTKMFSLASSLLRGLRKRDTYVSHLFSSFKGMSINRDSGGLKNDGGCFLLKRRNWSLKKVVHFSKNLIFL